MIDADYRRRLEADVERVMRQRERHAARQAALPKKIDAKLLHAVIDEIEEALGQGTTDAVAVRLGATIKGMKAHGIRTGKAGSPVEAMVAWTMAARAAIREGEAE